MSSAVLVALLALAPLSSAGADGARQASAIHHSGPTLLTLKNGWKNSPFGTNKAAAERTGGIVYLKGAIYSNGTSTLPFTIPAGFRPPKSVYVRVIMCKARSGRLFIQPTGVVTLTATTSFSDAKCMTSLDGASYALNAPFLLTLQNGWTNGPYSTSNAAAVDIQGVVHLKGAIATAGTNSIAFTLPKAFRPSKPLFVAIGLCDAAKGRLYVQPTGVVSVETQAAWTSAQCFTSLDGASYALTASTALALQHGWKNGPFGTSNATATLLQGVVHFKGAINTNGTNGIALTLPTTLRPSKPVYLPIALCNAGGGQLIIEPSGTVTVQAETSWADAKCFTSLDGASFAL